MYRLEVDDLSGEPTRALIALHLAGMHSASPPGTVFALDLSGLQVPEVTVWSVWREDAVAGIGALKMLGEGAAEVKSMRTHPDFLRRGVAACLLDHIIAEARRRDVARLSLETGRGGPFEAAEALYRKRGFVAGEAFSDYEPNEFSQFFHLVL
jgi:putative acetyltransferase